MAYMQRQRGHGLEMGDILRLDDRTRRKPARQVCKRHSSQPAAARYAWQLTALAPDQRTRAFAAQRRRCEHR